MNSLAFGLNTVEAMYDLCLLNQQAPLGEREWSNPNNNLKIALAGTQTRFALWGLLITAKGVADWGYPQPLLGRFTWKEDASNVGNISIQGPQTSNEMVDNVTSPTSSPSSNITVPDPDDNDLASSKTSSNPPTALTNPTPLETGIGLTISLTYNGASLRNKDVFEILLAAMTVTADHPSSSDFCGIAPGYGLSITSEVNPDGTCRLLYRHVYKLCRVIARWLVAERKFQEMDIVLTKGDVLVAEGRLMAGLPYGSRVQLANTTLLDHITA